MRLLGSVAAVFLLVVVEVVNPTMRKASPPRLTRKWKQSRSVTKDGSTIRQVVFAGEFDRALRCSGSTNVTQLLCGNRAFQILDQASWSRMSRNRGMAVRVSSDSVYAVALLLPDDVRSSDPVDSCRVKFVHSDCGSDWPASGTILANFSYMSDDDYVVSPVIVPSKKETSIGDWKDLGKYYHQNAENNNNLSYSSLLDKFQVTTTTGRRILSDSERDSGVVQLTKFDSAVLTMLEVSARLRDLVNGKTRLREGTIFEIIINPMQNAMSAMMPEIIWWVVKEILVAVIEYILEQMVVPVFTEPVLNKLVPKAGGALPLKDKTCVKDRSIKCATDEDCADKAPCDTDKTCSKDRTIKCHNDEECGDKAPCDLGKTCVKDRSIKCSIDADCGDKAPCDTDKTCAKEIGRASCRARV